LVVQLTKGATQSDRIIVNMVGNISPRDAGNAIKTFYESHKWVKEVKILLGGKEINVDYDQVKNKKFTKRFMGWIG
jgi:hypothetical protein